MNIRTVKKIALSLLLITLIFSSVSCKKEQEPPSSSEPAVSSSEPAPSSEPQLPKGNINPLTGLYDLSDSAVGMRPFAVMINNVSAAQAVQSGLSCADIVYEALVEGGITRLMALFGDPAEAGELGSVRSARYVYTDLAAGHDAIYVHAGGDPVYAMPHVSETGLDAFNIDDKYSYASHRVDNGLPYEHRLFTSGAELMDALEKSGVQKEIADEYKSPVFDFALPDESAKLSGGKAENVHVAFSDYYYSDYVYDPAGKNYLKSQNGQPHIDHFNDKQLSVKNIFVLFTDVGFYPDNLHLKIGLDSGTGYYYSEGNEVEILWEKGGYDDRLKLKKADGSPLTVNAGNSWISLGPESHSASFSD
ncbi:MAG TPA: hypothetical protein DEQ02_05715 [Ruminococcaceae bacterium]|nr:hypothetical protein [Oscillospiraceae bacterium]